MLVHRKTNHTTNKKYSCRMKVLKLLGIDLFKQIDIEFKF